MQRFRRFGAFLVLAVTVLWLLRRYFYMTDLPFLGGADAYYYAMQVKNLVATGALKIPDFSPLYGLLWLTVRLGLTCTQAVVLWTLLIQLLIGINLVLARRMLQAGKGVRLGPLLLCCWALASPTLAFTCLEFPKYAFALAFVPLWLPGLVEKKYILTSLAALALSCVSHRAMVGLAGLLLLGVLLFGGLRRWREHLPKSPLFYAAAAMGVLAVTWVGRRYFSLLDIERFNLQGLQPPLWTLLIRPEVPIVLKFETVGSFLLIVGAIWRSRQEDWRLLAWGWLPFLALLLVPLGSAEVMGAPERLVLIVPLCAMCACIVWHSAPAGSQAGSWGRRLVFAGAALALASISAWPGFYGRLYHPDRLNPDNALYQKVTAAVAPLRPEMLIAHRGLNFYYQYVTLGEAFPYEPEPHWPKERIWRVAYGISAAEWAAYLPAANLWGSDKFLALPGPYTLIREDLWDLFRRGVESSEDEDLRDRVFHLWLNPATPRPAFLYPKHRGEKGTGPFTARPPRGRLGVPASGS